MLKIKDLRKNKKETQEYLANVLGVSIRTIQYYENGSVTVPNDKLTVIAKHYDVEVSALFGDAQNDFAKSDYIDAAPLTEVEGFGIKKWATPKEGLGNYNYFIVKDESMDGGTGVVKKGDLILLKKIEKTEWKLLDIDNYIYLLDHKDFGFIIRQVIEQKKRTLKLHALNVLFADVLVKLSDVRGVFQVIDLKRRISF